MISIGNQELDKVYIGSQEMDKVYIGSTLVFEKSTPPTPTTLTWSPNPFYMNNVASWGTTDYVLATATAPATGSYNVYINAHSLQNTYYTPAEVRFEIHLQRGQSSLVVVQFTLEYQSQDPYGEQKSLPWFNAQAGDVLTIVYKYRDNEYEDFNLNGSVSIS